MEQIPEVSEESPEAEWERFGKELFVLKEKLNDLIIAKKGENWGEIFFNIPSEFAKKLLSEFKDCHQYYAYHILLESSTSYEKSPKLDFPEPFSVKTFIQNKIEELNQQDPE